jgi:hypothetical protein
MGINPESCCSGHVQGPLEGNQSKIQKLSELVEFQLLRNCYFLGNIDIVKHNPSSNVNILYAIYSPAQQLTYQGTRW